MAKVAVIIDEDFENSEYTEPVKAISNGPVHFARNFMASGKPIFCICHGAQLLISAQALQNRTFTIPK